MSWIGIAVSAAVGGVVAGAASPLITKFIRSPGIQRVVYMLIFATALAAARTLLAPWAEREYEIATLEDDLAGRPVFVAMKSYEPATYAKIVETAKNQVRAGATMDQIAASSLATLQDLATKRIPTTSDAAAVGYLRSTVALVKELHAAGGDNCYKALYPSKTEPFLPAKMASKEVKAADEAALIETLRAGSLTPQTIPKQAAFDANFERAAKTMPPALLNRLQSLAEPQVGVEKRRAVCDTAIQFYEHVFRLPTDQAGVIVRYLIANG